MSDYGSGGLHKGGWGGGGLSEIPLKGGGTEKREGETKGAGTPFTNYVQYSKPLNHSSRNTRPSIRNLQQKGKY